MKGLDQCALHELIFISSRAAMPAPSKTMKSFLFINCSNNQRLVVEAADQDQALRAAAKQTGHFFLMFIKTL